MNYDEYIHSVRNQMREWAVEIVCGREAEFRERCIESYREQMELPNYPMTPTFRELLIETMVDDGICCEADDDDFDEAYAASYRGPTMALIDSSMYDMSASEYLAELNEYKSR